MKKIYIAPLLLVLTLSLASCAEQDLMEDTPEVPELDESVAVPQGAMMMGEVETAFTGSQAEALDLVLASIEDPESTEFEVAEPLEEFLNATVDMSGNKISLTVEGAPAIYEHTLMLWNPKAERLEQGDIYYLEYASSDAEMSVWYGPFSLE